LLTASLVLWTAQPVSAQDGDAGVQVTPDMERVLVNKDVNGERWSIVRNPDDTVTGNVYLPDGGEPAFIWCEPRDQDDDDIGDFFDDLIDDLIGGDDDDDDQQQTYSCFGAGACDDDPCPDDDWTFIADIELAESFFRP